ncbi:isoform 2 of non-canonical poly(a) rna polymerase papd5 [Fagus crenata]
MLGKVRTHGHGSFIILPDLPSCDLPSLCFKKSRGLLSRVIESNHSEHLVFDSSQLFDSMEGESVDKCSCSVKRLDTVTVSEELVEDLDEFVKVMDEVSNGGFLRGEESELGSDWVELERLKEERAVYCEGRRGSVMAERKGERRV